MSFTEEKREAIRKYMLNKIREDDSQFLRKTADNFGVSETSVRRYAAACLDAGVIEKNETGRCGYRLKETSVHLDYENDGTLEEDSVYFRDIAPLLKELPQNAGNIWYYAFTETMNNAIEHSRGSRISIEVKKDCLYTEISVTDNGIGIFRNIQEYVQDKLGINMDAEQAALELYKGRLTTSPEGHSGEGIFFVSKMLTEFALWSDGTVYSWRCEDREHFVKSHLIAYYNRLRGIGTMAVMKLANETARGVKEVFDEYAPLDKGFVKTLIPVGEMCPLGDPVARSQARRILLRLDEFQEIVFDFRNVTFMGQGFADEVFRVFQNAHPDIRITVVNANRDIQGMIAHVKNT